MDRVYRAYEDQFIAVKILYHDYFLEKNRKKGKILIKSLHNVVHIVAKKAAKIVVLTCYLY